MTSYVELSNVEPDQQEIKHWYEAHRESQENRINEPRENYYTRNPNQKKKDFISFILCWCCFGLTIFTFVQTFKQCIPLEGIENQCNGWGKEFRDDLIPKYINCAFYYEECQTKNCSICAKVGSDNSVECLGQNFGCITIFSQKVGILIALILLTIAAIMCFEISKLIKQRYFI